MKKNWIISALILVGMMVWILSGSKEKNLEEEQKKASSSNSDFKVEIDNSSAESVDQVISFSGRIEPFRRVTLSAEVEGKVKETGVKRGDKAKKGDLIVELDESDLKYKEAEAQAQVEQRELEYNGAKELMGKGGLSAGKLAEAKSKLDGAKASLERAKIDLKNTHVVAPFDGELQERMVEEGDYVSRGKPLAIFIEGDPMRAIGEVTEEHVAKLTLGEVGYATLNNGKKLEGFLSYIAPESNMQSRTFRVELKIRNLENANKLGQTVKIEIPVGKVMAHKIAASHLSLNDKDDIGIKYLDSENKVHFGTGIIEKTEGDYIWLSGLPENILLVTYGQGFVKEGQQVNSKIIKR